MPRNTEPNDNDGDLPMRLRMLHIQFSPEQIAWIEIQAKKRAISLSEIVRRLVDEARGAFLMSKP